jgi:hypothetical protein
MVGRGGGRTCCHEQNRDESEWSVHPDVCMQLIGQRARSIRTDPFLFKERQELEARLADTHRDRERLDGHLRDGRVEKVVRIFTVVVVIAAVQLFIS